MSKLAKLSAAVALSTAVLMQPSAAEVRQVSPAQLESIIKKSGNRAEGGGALNAATVSASQLIGGVNTLQCGYAVTVTSGALYYVFAFNTDGSYIFASSNVSYLTSKQAALIDVCRASTTYYVNITDPVNGTWNWLRHK